MKRTSRTSLLVLCLSFGLVTFSACGSDQTNTTAGAGGAAGAGASGPGGAGGTGGTGGAAACQASETIPCYDGPAGTEAVGSCKGGTYACVNGQWDKTTCVGEVLPSGAADVCDGKDEDCNGSVDDGIAQITCGMGVCTVTVDGCANGTVPACVPLPATSADDKTCDGADDDCDGQIDEDCPCINDGDTKPCYSGSAGTKGVGECKEGTQTCLNNTWGPCVGEILPATETCNGKDDDCSGQTDENLGQTSCGAGACFVTVDNCVNGVPTPCTPLPPSVESCNGKDDDCNLLIDDGLGMLTCGQGACMVSVPACSGGQPNVCTPGMAMAEQCDGVDNDCDGTVDDGNPGGGTSCMTGQPGVCAAGTFNCTAGQLVCNPTTPPSAETCNAKDDNCNGQIDEMNPGGGAACNTGLLGICAQGTTNCQNGGIVCTQKNQPTSELCDGLDNNCNGATDEGNPGGGTACSTNKPGVCAAGTLSCQNGSPMCVQTNQPSVEICDGLDNNCNGTADEGNPGSGGVCSTGQLGICAAGTYQCQNGTLACAATNMPKAELCNGQDDDCNGMVDNGNPGGGAACSTGQLGVCAPGTTTCSNGMVSCVPMVMATAEICDNKDNDCDGAIDDGNPGGGAACSTGLMGVCGAGLTNCSGGVVSCMQTTSSSPEICDGKDNNCNGTTDEGNPGGGIACTTGLPGVCSAGFTQCQGGVQVCVATTMASAEVCDGLDNNCDGTVDNGNPGGGAACSTGLPAPCSNGTTVCTAGVLVCGGTVSNLMNETFATATSPTWNGWTLGTEWGIGVATASSGQDGRGPDPALDHSPSADNKLAGVVIGGNASIAALHGYYYLTSPVINASGTGSIVLDFWRWLNSDDYPWMSNIIQVYNGSAWVTVWEAPTAVSVTGQFDTAWLNVLHDLTAYKNANMQIRFGFKIGLVDIDSWRVSSWNIDDVVVRRCQ